MAESSVIICLKSVNNNKYLRYRYEEVQTHGLLQFAADKVMDPYAQFEVENSKTSEGLVHLKSRFNNKYLVRWSPNHYWITASGNKKDEDQKSWTCTLFKPTYISSRDDQKMRLMHVQLGHYASLMPIGAPFDSCLFAGSKETDASSRDVFTSVYWSDLFRFPRRAAFKGVNGKYLGACMWYGVPYLRFAYDNVNDPMVAQEIITTRDGTLCIRSGYFGKFWRLGDGDWVVADADDPRGTSNTHAMFRASVLDINVIALLNMYKTWFVKSYYCQGLDRCLNAAAQNIDNDAVLEVVDLSKMREN